MAILVVEEGSNESHISQASLQQLQQCPLSPPIHTMLQQPRITQRQSHNAWTELVVHSVQTQSQHDKPCTRGHSTNVDLHCRQTSQYYSIRTY